MTFSIVARCIKTGQFGAAVASSSPAVASRCIRAKAGVGAAASQNITDPALGNMTLQIMDMGLTPDQTLQTIASSQQHVEYRQLMAIDGKNPPAVFTGNAALGVLGSATGEHAACAGNMLAHPDIPQIMLRAFENSTGCLAERLMQALLAGQQAGGEAGPVHSAGLLVVDNLSWPLVDLRLDWYEDTPIEALYRTWKVYEPQVASYVTRAQDPRAAPSFGVPGDE